MERQEVKINSHPPVPSHPLHWFPEFWELGRKRIRPQARLLGLSLLVGIISDVASEFRLPITVRNKQPRPAADYHAG